MISLWRSAWPRRPMCSLRKQKRQYTAQTGEIFHKTRFGVAVYQRGQRRVGCVADGVGQFARGDGEFARVGDELGGDGVVRRVVHRGAHFVSQRVLVFSKQAVQGGGGEVGAPREFFRGHEGGRCVGFVAAPLPQVFTYA